MNSLVQLTGSRQYGRTMNRMWLLVIYLGSVGTLGCQPFRAGHSYFPPGAVPAPPGTYLRQWQAAHADKAHRDGVVLQEAAWIDHSDRLGPAAIERLLSAFVSQSRAVEQITLEPAEDAALNARRKQVVQDLLAQQNIDFPIQSIVCGISDANIMYGQESVRLGNELMQGNHNMNNQGATGFGSFFSGFTGSGSGSGYFGPGHHHLFMVDVKCSTPTPLVESCSASCSKTVAGHRRVVAGVADGNGMHAVVDDLIVTGLARSDELYASRFASTG